MIKHAYIESSVLSNWLLLFRASRKNVEKAEERALESYKFLDEVKQRLYSLEFSTSEWALAEITESVVDGFIAKKIIRDGQSLAYFGRLQERYRLSPNEMFGIEDNIARFRKLLERHKIRVIDSPMNSAEVQRIILKHRLRAPDALHLHYALAGKFDYLITLDTDLLDLEEELPVKIVKPSTLRTRRYSL